MPASKKPAEAQPFRFESYGAVVEISGNSQELIDRAAETARESLLGRVSPTRSRKVHATLRIDRTGRGMVSLTQNGLMLTDATAENAIFYKYLDTIIRVTVGEATPDLVFIHAGAVSWKGNAIILPGDSFAGKSTLVAELVRRGAEYYSDDFAVFDADGRLHPFHRPLGMRSRPEDGAFTVYKLSVDELKGRLGHKPTRPAMVLFTNYKKGARFRPRTLSSGEGVLELVQYALPMRRNADFTFRVLNKIASRAIIISGSRGTAENFAKTLLNFVDKNVN